MRIILAFIATFALAACGPSPSENVIRALGQDSASNCFGGQGYGIGAFGGRANDPTVSVEVGPTGCKITHGNGTGAVVIVPSNGSGPAQVIRP